ncbi:hypothetical protein [Psychrobacter sp. JCM 18900]|uniref:hypothetical protein n=1 Tax=Psychrobacter sp. JCM 18900 TaxID=1298608 RepID=UPI000436D9B3|nr:hypothetical protein [Psychrobacter sp. JCM 18900]GAF53190.1 hypothetical protein JCM18900_11750 [Psychrobacter sp. JCM 18900]
MELNEYTVHKLTALCYRKAVATYLIQINRSSDIPKIMSQFSDLDDFEGDRMPLAVVTNEFNLATYFFQDDYIGLKVFNYIEIESLPFYKGISQCITPLINANIDIPLIVLCRLISRYFKVMTESIEVHLFERKDLIRLEFNPSVPEQVNKHQIDGIIFSVYKIISTFSSLKPVELTLAHRQSSQGFELYKQFLGVSAEMSKTVNSLTYRIDRLITVTTHRNTQKNTVGSTFFINPLHHMLDKNFTDTSYTQRCQHILITIMGLHEPTREQVAQVLNMSVSSLQRRLREEGTSFKTLLLEVRKKVSL